MENSHYGSSLCLIDPRAADLLNFIHNLSLQTKLCSQTFTPFTRKYPASTHFGGKLQKFDFYPQVESKCRFLETGEAIGGNFTTLHSGKFRVVRRT